MKPPRKAFVLAAGFGARVLPLTLSRPKALFPIWGKPILRHSLELLRDWGVRDALINLHCHAGQIVDHLRLNPVPGLHCSFSFEPELLETGGALPRARWWVCDEAFWMLNADILADLDPQPLVDAFDRYRPPAVLWMHDSVGPRTVEIEDGRILDFRSRRPGTPGTFTFCGLQLLSPRVSQYLPSLDFFSVITVYERAMQAGEILRGVAVPGAFWADIGTPSSYLAAHRDIRAAYGRGQAGARFYAGPRPSLRAQGSTFVSIGSNVRISPRARVADSVIWDHSTVTGGSTVCNAIVADNVTVGGAVSYIAMRTAATHDPLLSLVLRRLRWSEDNALILPLPPRGSDRTFARIACGRRTAMLVQYTGKRPENALYAAHARFLRRIGVTAPHLLLDFPDDQACVVEDVGDCCLQKLVTKSSQMQIAQCYRQTLDMVIRLHERGFDAARRYRLPLSQPFSRHLYEWEQDLFVERFLRQHVRPAEDRLTMAIAELRALIPSLLRGKRVLVHRDLQSSNILLKNGTPVLIDFQGMRFGPAAYDLASLLCDPYVSLPLPLREALLDYYEERASDGWAVRRLFWVAAVERLAQALGAFGRLGANAATAGFLRHIPAGVRELRRAVGKVGGLPVLDEILSGYEGGQS